MINEIFRVNDKETTIQLANNSIKAIRRKDIIKIAIRVYHNGRIGVAGQYGEENLDKLFEKAEENLRLNIRYPCEVSKNMRMKVESKSVNMDIDKIIEETEELVKDLKDSGFIVSGNIKISELKTNIVNDEKLYCYMRNEKLQIKLILKEKNSSNIFDLGYNLNGRIFNKDLFLKEINERCEAHRRIVQMPISKDGKVRCIFVVNGDLLGFFGRELNGKRIGSNTSVFNNKLGEKLFNENVTIYAPNDLEEDGIPFDREGTLVKGVSNPFINKGLVSHGYCDKRTAKICGFEPTGNGFGEFDGVPTLRLMKLTLERGQQTLKELLNGQPAVFISTSMGGDFTSDGNYASPVQSAYLYDGEKFTGRVPEFSIESNVYDMFGDDFVGIASYGFNDISMDKLAIIDMKGSNIG